MKKSKFTESQIVANSEEAEREAVAHCQPSFLGNAGKELSLRSDARIGLQISAHNPDITYVMKQQIATISAIAS